MYESPIELITTNMMTEIEKDQKMTGVNMEYEIDTSGKLVIGLRYAKEDEIPRWLKEEQRKR